VSPITSCRLSVAVAMSLQICNGKQSRKRRSKTEAKETADESEFSSTLLPRFRDRGYTSTESRTRPWVNASDKSALTASLVVYCINDDYKCL